MFFRVISLVNELELSSSELIIELNNYIIENCKAEISSDCFYLIEDYGENEFDPCPIEDVSVALKSIIHAPKLGGLEYNLPFGRVMITYKNSKTSKIQFVIFSIEDYYFDENKNEFYLFITNLHSNFRFVKSIGGWELENIEDVNLDAKMLVIS